MEIPCWLNRQVSAPVPGRLHRAPRKSSGVETVPAVQAVQAVDVEPQVKQVEVSQEKQMAKPEVEEPLEDNQDVKEKLEKGVGGHP